MSNTVEMHGFHTSCGATGKDYTILYKDANARERLEVLERVAMTEGKADSKINEHNTNTGAHNDMRLLIQGLTDRLNALANSDDATLDQLAEVVAYIKANRGLIEGVTTSKVNVADIVNDLATNAANVPLSAAQGVALKALIDAIAIPSNVSAFTNDAGYLDALPTHEHSASEITSGALPLSRGGTGATDAATALANIGAAAAEHTHDQYLTEHQDLSAYAKIADIAATATKALSNSAVTYAKIGGFGEWGAGAWYEKGFSMLITSRAGEMVWLAVSSDDSNTNAKAIRLLNTYSKIQAVYYSVSESAVYVKVSAWCNNVNAHILSNVNGDYVPTVEQASGLPSDAVQVGLTEFGPTGSATNIGNTGLDLTMKGKSDRPTYNGANVALASDIPAKTTEQWTFTLEDGSTVTKAVHIG